MTRFASAPWPLKAAYVGTLAAAGVVLLSGLTAVIALAGLKRLSPDIDPAQVAAWFWYFRDDPHVRRWLGVGLLSAFGGAGLDSVAIEPLPPQSPLWTAPRLIITPHQTPRLPDRADRSLDIVCENIRRWRAGLPLLNRLTAEDVYTPG